MNTREKKKEREFGPLPEIGFLRRQQVQHMLGITKTTLYANIKKGLIPAPKKLTSRTSVWSVNEIRELIERVEQQGCVKQ